MSTSSISGDLPGRTRRRSPGSHVRQDGRIHGVGRKRLFHQDLDIDGCDCMNNIVSPPIRYLAHLNHGVARIAVLTIHVGRRSTFVTKIRMQNILVILHLYWNTITLVLIWKVLRQAFTWYHYIWNPSTFGRVIYHFLKFSLNTFAVFKGWFSLSRWKTVHSSLMNLNFC
jgi:hypothetical protein